METGIFVKDGHSYCYTIHQTQQQRGRKKVYLISFPQNPPEGLQANQTYCLKRMDWTPQAEATIGTRDFWDVMDFSRDGLYPLGVPKHLRRILLRDDAAEALAKQMFGRVFQPPREQMRFSVIEPVLYPISAAAPSYAQRMDYMIQAVEGLQELHRVTLPTSDGQRAHVLCYRDLKLENMMVEENGTLVLIDFATIETDIPLESAQGFSTTDTMDQAPLASYSNVTPEALNPELPRTEQWDVFPLAGILCEVFGTLNPIFRYFSHCKTNHSAYQEQMSRLNLEQTQWNPNGLDWYESIAEYPAFRSLSEKQFQWNVFAEQPLFRNRLRRLVWQMMRYHPDDRATLDQVLETLTSLSSQLSQEAPAPFTLVLVDPFAPPSSGRFHFRSSANQITDQLCRNRIEPLLHEDCPVLMYYNYCPKLMGFEDEWTHIGVYESLIRKETGKSRLHCTAKMPDGQIPLHLYQGIVEKIFVYYENCVCQSIHLISNQSNAWEACLQYLSRHLPGAGRSVIPIHTTLQPQPEPAKPQSSASTPTLCMYINGKPVPVGHRNPSP